MVVAIGIGGADIARSKALGHVFGYAVGFDLIRRDVMHACIADQHSWDLCKSFDGASPISAIVPAEAIGHPDAGAITLDINGGRTPARRPFGDDLGRPRRSLRACPRSAGWSPAIWCIPARPKGPDRWCAAIALDGRVDGIGALQVRIV